MLVPHRRRAWAPGALLGVGASLVLVGMSEVGGCALFVGDLDGYRLFEAGAPVVHDDAHEADVTPSKMDAGHDASDATAAFDGPTHEAGTLDGGAHDGGSPPDAPPPPLDASHHDAGMDAASACSGLQTAFALSAQENKNNANVTSGVAARTSDKVILFQLASTKADGGGSSITLYAQAFDATTGTSLGAPGVIYATTQAGSGTVYLQDIAVAPSGELVLLYAFGEGQIYGELLGAPTMISELHAAFFSLAPPGDGGLTGLAFQRDVVLESGFFGGQAMAVWAAGEFILSWQYVAAEAPLSVAIKVSPYAATGGPNSGGVAEVPALPVGTSYVANTGPQQGAVGVSGSMLAVAFLSAGNEAPVVTFLAETGAVVDNPLQLPGTGPSATWVTVAGTSSGFAYIYSTSSSVGEAFIPAGSVAMDAAAPAVMTFPFTGAGQAYGGRAVGDGVHGTAGVALLYPDGVYFSLVSASGQAHSSPAAIINQTVTSPPTTGYPLFNVGTFGGSYVVGLYNPATQSTQAAWSGCQPPP